MKKKKERKSRRNKQNEEQIEEEIQEQLDTIPRPRLLDLLPIKLVLSLAWAVRSMPEWGQCLVEIVREKWRERNRKEEEEDEDSDG